METYGLAIKVLMTCSATFIDSFRWLSVIQLTFGVMLLWLYVMWVPMLHNWVNHVRCGSYAAIAYAGLMFVLISYQV